MGKRIAFVSLFALLFHCADSYRGDVPAPAPAGGVDGGGAEAPVPAGPTPELTLAPFADVIVPVGGTVSVPVTVTRATLDGPVTITVSDLPEAVSVSALTLAANENTGTLTFQARASFSPAVVMISVTSGDATLTAMPAQVLARGAAGSFDTSFGSGGSTSSLFGNESVAAVDVAPLGGGGYAVLADKTPSTAILSTVSLRGMASAPVALGFADSGAIALQRDGQLLVGGIDADRTIHVRRYSPAGALDAAFASGGLALGSAPSKSDGAVRGFLVGESDALVLYRNVDGSYLDGFGLAGASTSHVRLTGNATYDPLSFGRVGASVVSFLSAGGGARYYAQTVSDGGTGTLTSTPYAASDPLDATPPAPRGATGADRAYLPFSKKGSVTSGTTLITSAGNAAETLTSLDTAGHPVAMVVQPDGKLVVAYASERAVNVVRYLTAGGTRDAAFGTQGLVALPYALASKEAGKVRIYGLEEDRLLVFVDAVEPGGRSTPTFYRLWL